MAFWHPDRHNHCSRAQPASLRSSHAQFFAVLCRFRDVAKAVHAGRAVAIALYAVFLKDSTEYALSFSLPVGCCLGRCDFRC
jgi:hypothetical protein